MTVPTPKGWYTAKRFVELQAVATVVSSKDAYRPSPNVVTWDRLIPGDCTELTAVAEWLLTGMGWPLAAMERWICKTRSGRKHAVLVVHITLSEGPVVETVIDCRHDKPMRREDLYYTDWSRMP